MKPINDGGSAFPTSTRMQERYMDDGGTGRSRMVSVDADGMSLRDWFAGCALPRLIEAGAYDSDMDDDEMRMAACRECYRIADAMLKAREESSDEQT